MKEFEKWDGAENRCRKCEVEQSMCNMVNDSIACKAIRKEAWKAALEMIRDVAINADGPEHNCYYEILDALDKELEVEDL